MYIYLSVLCEKKSLKYYAEFDGQKAHNIMRNVNPSVLCKWYINCGEAVDCLAMAHVLHKV